MANQGQNFEDNNLRKNEQNNFDYYTEETSAEIAAPVALNRNQSRNNNTADTRNNDTADTRNNDTADTQTSGKGIGVAALVLSILSLFVMPILFGAAGIVLGFIARRKGSTGLGNWAIGLGAISIIVGIFIVPFF